MTRARVTKILMISVGPAFLPLLFKFVPVLILPHLVWWNLGLIPVTIISKLIGFSFFRFSEFGVVLSQDGFILHQILASIFAAGTWATFLFGTILLKERRLFDRMNLRVLGYVIAFLVVAAGLATVILPLLMK